MIQQLITKSPEIVCKCKIYLAVRGLLLLIFSQETLCRWDVGWRMVDVGWWMWDVSQMNLTFRLILVLRCYLIVINSKTLVKLF